MGVVARAAAVLCAVVIVVGCDEPTRARPAPRASATPGGSAGPVAFVHPAERCAECHARADGEWRASAHARAATSPAYLQWAAEAGKARCEPCHAPLAGHVAPGDPVLAEGVGCDACHTADDAAVRPEGGALSIDVTRPTRYGPLCDAKDHYFHRMGCGPVFREARFCGACHLARLQTSAGVELPIFTEYDEWTKSPQAAEGRSCQSCHMPDHPGEAATGSPRRPRVAHHGMLGDVGELRASALEVKGTLSRGGAGVIEASVVVQNRGAAHAVPTGLPARRFVLRVRALGPGGDEIARVERAYGRVLVDASGAEVPFHRAARVASDNRLLPGAPRLERFDLDARGAESVQMELVYQPIAPVVARAGGVEPPAERILATRTTPLGARRGPIQVELAP